MALRDTYGMDKKGWFSGFITMLIAKGKYEAKESMGRGSAVQLGLFILSTERR